MFGFGIFESVGNILESKRATGAPLVAKQPDFPGLFRFAKKSVIRKISVFFGFLAEMFGRA